LCKANQFWPAMMRKRSSLSQKASSTENQRATRMVNGGPRHAAGLLRELTATQKSIASPLVATLFSGPISAAWYCIVLVAAGH
jgi:hypothetical protein